MRVQMLHDVRLTVFDPRKGLNQDIKFGRRKILRSAAHQWVILDANVKLDKESSVMATFLSSFIQRLLETYREEKLLIQHGPPIYQEREAMQFPTSWKVVIESRDSRILYVPREQFSEFEAYFKRASSYEQWMFFFVSSNSLTTLRAFKPEFLNLDHFLNPPFRWNELIHIEGDFGAVLCYLPFSEKTDRFVGTLIQEGVATPALRSLTHD